MIGRTLAHPLLWRFFGSIAIWLLAPSGHLVGPAVAASSCPAGSAPRAIVRLAAFDLPGEIPPGASIVVARVTLAPGEELQPETAGYTAFVIESGTLEFQVPLRGGVHMEHPAHCDPAGGVYSTSITELVDDEGWMRVEAGSALVADEVPIARIRNAGTSPLELLQVTLRLPEIDPATGEPVGDELVSDRGRRERQNERRDHREATPTP